MKVLNPAPHSLSSPPSSSSLPCGVNVAKKRRHQPIYTSIDAIAFSPRVLFACLARVSTPPSTALFFVFLCTTISVQTLVEEYGVQCGPSPGAAHTCRVRAVPRRCCGPGITTRHPLSPSSCAPSPKLRCMPTLAFLLFLHHCKSN